MPPRVRRPTLGPYTAYVAWIAPPLLHPFRRLGEVPAEGRVELGRIELDKFLLLVSAEADATVDEPTGQRPGTARVGRS